MPASLLSGWKVKDLYLVTVLFVTVHCLNNINMSGNPIFNDPQDLVDQHHRRLRTVFQDLQKPQQALATTSGDHSETGASGSTDTRKKGYHQSTLLLKGQDPRAYQDLKWGKLQQQQDEELSSRSAAVQNENDSRDDQQKKTIQSPEDTMGAKPIGEEQTAAVQQDNEGESSTPVLNTDANQDPKVPETQQSAETPEDEISTEIREEEEVAEEVFQCDANNTLCCAPLEASENVIDDWWTHHPDWEELTLQDAHTNQVCFLPMPQEKKATFFRQLYAMQYASHLCHQDLQVWQINAGYGASLNQIVRGLWTAHNQGRPFQMTKHWPGARWLYSTNLTDRWNYCPTTDMNCYFLPLGSCPPEYRRNDDYAQAATNTKDEKQRFQWTRQYVGRLRHRVRKQLLQALQQSSLPALKSLENNCTVMHVRRGDVGYPRHPFRRYAAVQEYLDIGNLTKGETIVLLTDDETTIQEVQEWHAKDYNWVWMDRPRNHGVNNGMDGHIPSQDEGAEIVAILAEVRLASQCHKIVHGHSGFVTTIKDELDAVGREYTSVFLDTKLSHQEMREWRQKYNPALRADYMIEAIRERYRNQTTTSDNNKENKEGEEEGEQVEKGGPSSEVEPVEGLDEVTEQAKQAVDQSTPSSKSSQEVQEQESPLLPAEEDKEETSSASIDPAKRLEEEMKQAIQEEKAAFRTEEEEEYTEADETSSEVVPPAKVLDEQAMHEVPSTPSLMSHQEAQAPQFPAENREEPSSASIDPATRRQEEMKQATQENALASSMEEEGDEEAVHQQGVEPEVRTTSETETRKTSIVSKTLRQRAARVTPKASPAAQQQRERIAKMRALAKKKLEEMNRARTH